MNRSLLQVEEPLQVRELVPLALSLSLSRTLPVSVSQTLPQSCQIPQPFPLPLPLPQRLPRRQRLLPQVEGSGQTLLQDQQVDHASLPTAGPESLQVPLPLPLAVPLTFPISLSFHRQPTLGIADRPTDRPSSSHILFTLLQVSITSPSDVLHR